jgi:RHS repeat-associated protein
MIQSADKGINVDIRYSYLNKPEELDFGNGEKINYIYDGAGNKLAKIIKDGDALPGSSLIYSGNFVYDLNGNLQYILTGEGRLVPDNNTYRFEYVMKDHLGNTRATYARAAPGLAQVAEYQHYYPFGMELEGLGYTSGADIPNFHLYNGKELQPDYNLQWYDYGARFYDPQLGRWHSVDPLAEKSRRWSPYTYGLDNPIRFIDPDGMNVDDYFSKTTGTYLATDNAKTDNIRIIDESTYNSINTATQFSNDASEDSNTQALQNSSELANGSNLTNSTASAILNHYFSESGFDKSSLTNNSVKIGEMPYSVASTAYGPQYNLPKGKFEITVDKREFGSRINNKWDVINMFIHEMGGHGKDFIKAEKLGIQPLYNSDRDGYKWEKNAIKIQKEDPSWNKTSKEFQKTIDDILN